jgi:hypothetical protein
LSTGASDESAMINTELEKDKKEVFISEYLSDLGCDICWCSIERLRTNLSAIITVVASGLALLSSGRMKSQGFIGIQ